MILMAVIFVLFALILIARSLWFVLTYAISVAVLVSPFPLVFLLPPAIVEKSFAVVEIFVLYKKTFKRSLILGLLYSLVSSAVSSLIPIVGGTLNTVIVIQDSLLYIRSSIRIIRKKNQGFFLLFDSARCWLP